MKPPIETLALFPVLNQQLISFLKQLQPADWQRQTVARKWVVKDVAAHLLDGNFRRIALHRDGWAPPPDRKIDSYQTLVDYLNDLNAGWVNAMKRMSPALLVELLESTNAQVLELFSKLDPFAPAPYGVSWAGEELSQNWFDTAREYTERWLHQQQIRDAVGNRGLLTRELYHPFLHIFMQAWPFTCRDSRAEEGTVLRTVITGEGGGTWELKMQQGKWKIWENAETGATAAAETVIGGDVAWKLFSKSVRKEDIGGQFEIKGDHALGEKVLDMVSVMA